MTREYNWSLSDLGLSWHYVGNTEHRQYLELLATQLQQTTQLSVDANMLQSYALSELRTELPAAEQEFLALLVSIRASVRFFEQGLMEESSKWAGAVRMCAGRANVTFTLSQVEEMIGGLQTHLYYVRRTGDDAYQQASFDGALANWLALFVIQKTPISSILHGVVNANASDPSFRTGITMPQVRTWFMRICSAMVDKIVEDYSAWKNKERMPESWLFGLRMVGKILYCLWHGDYDLLPVRSEHLPAVQKPLHQEAEKPSPEDQICQVAVSDNQVRSRDVIGLGQGISEVSPTRAMLNKLRQRSAAQRSKVFRTDPDNNTEIKMSVLQQVSNEASDAAYRTAAKQLVKLVKEPLIAAIQRHLGPGDDGVRAKIAAFLETDMGGFVIQTLIAASMSMVPNTLPQQERLARELRVSSMADAGDMVADLLMGPLRDVISTYLKDVPHGIEVKVPALSDGANIDEVVTTRQSEKIVR